MTYVLFTLGFIFTFVGAYASYSETFKISAWYFPATLGSAIISNIIWFYMAKHESNLGSLALKALFWDAVLMVTYVVVPILLFNARFTMLQIVGIIITVVGLIITKLVL